jgi:hypothetical protein
MRCSGRAAAAVPRRAKGGEATPRCGGRTSTHARDIESRRQEVTRNQSRRGARRGMGGSVGPWRPSWEGVADRVALPILYVAVQRVVADVGLAPDEPLWRIALRVTSCLVRGARMVHWKRVI